MKRSHSLAKNQFLRLCIRSASGEVLVEEDDVPCDKPVYEVAHLLGTAGLRSTLVTPGGIQMSPRSTLSDWIATESDALTLTAVHCKLPRLFATAGAFAALTLSGDIISWGKADCGGLISPAIRSRLGEVREVCAAKYAFAAVTQRGAVIAWGNMRLGGCTSVLSDSNNGTSPVDDSFLQRDIVNVCATWHAFLALRKDGKVFSWGYTLCGAGNRAVERYLQDKTVIRTKAGVGMFCAFLSDSKAILWRGGKYDVFEQVVDVALESGGHSDSAIVLKADGSVETSWGQRIINNLPYVSIFAGTYAFAGVCRDGTVTTWGEANLGGDSTSVEADLCNVKSFCNSWGAMAAIRSDDTVIAWGCPRYGGDVAAIKGQLLDVATLVSNEGAAGFVALKRDGSAFSWGDVEVDWPRLRKVKRVSCNGLAWAAVMLDGTVVAWGSSNSGDATLNAASKHALHGRFAEDVCGTSWSNNDRLGAFACLCSDNTVVTWGSTDVVPNGFQLVALS